MEKRWFSLKDRLKNGQGIAGVFVVIFCLMTPAVHAQENNQNLTLAPGTRIFSKSSEMALIGRDLAGLYNEYDKFSQLAGLYEASQFKTSNKYLHVAEGYVTVDAVAASDPTALLADLTALNMRKATMNGLYISGRLPISALPMIAKLKNLKFARPAYFKTNAGLTDSQGVEALRADIARPLYGVDGSGITVGTLSDSFDCLNGASTDEANGDLPPGVIVLDDSICPNGSDEGRAMMQLIADVAPGADQMFHTAFGGQADFAQGILELANAGADVIVDDVIYFAEPMFQDGIIAQAVDDVVADGSAYFSSAGNQSRQSYEAPFNPSGIPVSIGGSPAGEAHDFNPGAGVDIFQQITLPANTTLIVSFQWDSPYFSVSGGSGSPNDIDIYIFDSSEASIIAGGIDANIGGDPVEIVGISNSSPSSQNYNVLITNFSGSDPGLLKYVIFNSSATINEFNTASATAYGHSNAAGAEAVAAARFDRTPEFGIDPALVESFSSAGGVPILFDTAGNRLSSAEVREKPEITAPDGTNTTFFGSNYPDGDSFPNFFGTSAAAPHAAAVAALVLEANSSLLPAEIYAILEDTALDMDDPFTSGFDIGFDFVSGYGFIQADSALEAAVPPCFGDFNGNRIVDNEDLSVFAANFGLEVCGEGCAGNLDPDGDVDGVDLSIMVRQLEDGCN